MARQILSDAEILSSNQFYIGRRDGLDWNFEEKLFNEVKDYGLGGLIRKRLERYGGKERFSFFWDKTSPFAQWHQTSFTGSVYTIVNPDLLPDEFSEERQFTSTEQFMMYNKALLFVDRETATAIIKTDSPREQKALGRQVKNFDEAVWQFARSEIVLRGNRFKFSQNEEIKYELLETEGTTIVEASPYDKIWGIGLAENDERAHNRSTWQGLNLLGEILTELREEMLRQKVI